MGLLEENVPNPQGKVCAFIWQHQSWDLPRLIQTLHSHLIIKKILGNAMPIHNAKDSFCSGLNRSGEFSTKHATWIAHDIQSVTLEWSFKWRWKINTTPKIKIFLWQLCLKAIPVKGNLMKKGLNINPICPLCLDHTESTEIFIWLKKYEI